MTPVASLLVASLLGYGMLLWLGLYLALRMSVRRVLTWVSVLALWCQALYFASAALVVTAPDSDTGGMIERYAWSLAVLPLAFWFHLSTLLAAPYRSRWPRQVLLVYVLAALLIMVGTPTDLFTHFGQRDGRAGPLYPLYVVYQLLTAVGALLGVLYARRRATGPAAQQLSLLLGGALLFTGGAMWLGLRTMLQLPLTQAPAYLLLCAGVLVIGVAIARHGLLLDGQDVQRDLLYNVMGIGLLTGIYGALLWFTTGLSVGGALALITLVIVTHTAFDQGRGLLDRLFFSGDEQTARAEARAFATALGSEPVALPESAAEPDTSAEPEADDEPPVLGSIKTFRSEVRKAITGLKSPPRLVHSPLLTLRVVQQNLAANGQSDNRLHRVAALREVLIEQIEGLRPQAGGDTVVGDAWRFYNVLHYPYVREFSRKAALAEARRLRDARRGSATPPDALEQVLEWLADVDEDTFYKWQRRASDTIADTLWEQETMPQEQAN